MRASRTACVTAGRKRPTSPSGPCGTFSSDQVIDCVVAPIIYRVIFLPWTLPEVDVRTYVDDLCKRSA